MRNYLLACCLIGCLLLQGCNAGLGGVLYALLSDHGHGGGKKKSPEVLATAEFIALENARLKPAQSVIVLSLRSSAKKSVDLRVELSDGGAEFRPASVSPPPLGHATSNAPGILLHLPVSEAGTVSRIPWNALTDLGDDNLHRVKLRFSGDIDGPFVVDVLTGDDAPEIRDVAVTQSPGEKVSIAVVIADSSSDPVDVSLDFATDEDDAGHPFFGPAHSVAGNTALAAEPEGSPSALQWNAVSDAGPFDRPAAVRLTPFDRIAGQVGKIGKSVERMLSLDDNRPPEAEVLDGEVLTDPDQRRGVAIRFMVRDLEANPVDAIVQWTSGDDPFPDLDAVLDADAAARSALLDDADARKRLRIAGALSDSIEGPVEQPGAGVSLAANEVLASWIKAQGEIRGIAGGCGAGRCALEGRKAELVASTGESQSRNVCAYFPETGILRLDSAFDPPAGPGATLRIDLGGAPGTLRLASIASGALQQLIWDGNADVPGGGSIRFRVTPYDRVAAAAAGCSAAAGADAPGISQGGRGAAAESGGAKRMRGPFSDSDPWILPLAPIDEPTSLVAVDADGDGRMDLACAARLSNAVILLLQKRAGVFETLRLPDVRLRGPSGLVARDLDGDGDVDLAVSDDVSGQVLLIRQQPGLDFFSDRVSLTAKGELKSPAGITAADLDGDGNIDIAVAEAGGDKRGVRVFFHGAGPAGSTAAEGGYSTCMLLDPNNGEPHAIASAKITDDSTFDLVTAGNGFFAIYSLKVAGGELTFRYTRIDAPDTDFRSVAVGDLDGNGRLDLVAPDLAGRSVRIASQTSQVGFGLLEPLVSASLSGPLGIVQGDLDGNGVTDFAVADPGDPATLLGGNVCVFLGDGSGRRSADTLVRPASAASVSSSPRAVAAADFDGDGRIDLASADGGSHDVVVFRQGGKGAFRDPAEVLTSGQSLSAFSSLAAGDLNGDRKVDLLASSRETDSLTLFEQESAGAFAALAVPLPPSETTGGASTRRGPVAVVVGDLNGDGRADAVSANVDSNDLTVLIQDEHGDFTAFDVRADGFLGPQSEALCDIDGDGKLDIVAAARFSDDARWFRQGADGGFIEGGAFRASSDAGAPKILGPIFVAAGDLDRDGRTDIVTANHRSSNLTIFIQAEARGTFLSPIEVPLGTGIRPVAVALDDLDGNGTLDLACASLGRTAVSIFLQGKDGTLEPSSIAAISGVQPTSLAVRDLDGDGKADIVVAFSGQRGSFLKVYTQSSEAVFGDAKSLKLTASSIVAPVEILAADLDGDGEPDLTSANRQSRNVTVFYGGR